MGKLYNTKVDEFEIIDTIVGYLEDEDINILIDSHVMLRFQFKANKINKKKLDRNTIDEKIKKIYRNDINLKRKIIEVWNFNSLIMKSSNKNIKDIDGNINELIEKKVPLDIFDYCTILWTESDKELNEKGDKLYEEFKKALKTEAKENLDSENNVKDGEKIKVNNNIMDITIGDFIKNMASIGGELEDIKKELEDKKDENRKLKESLEVVSDNRDLLKEIKSINKKLIEVKNEVVNKNSLLLEEIKEIKKENEKLKEDIKSITECLYKFNIESLSKILIKNISDSQINMNNSLKGSIIESINKNVDNRFKAIEEKIEAKTINKEYQEIEDVSLTDKDLIEFTNFIDEDSENNNIDTSNENNELVNILKGLSKDL